MHDEICQFEISLVGNISVQNSFTFPPFNILVAFLLNLKFFGTETETYISIASLPFKITLKPVIWMTLP